MAASPRPPAAVPMSMPVAASAATTTAAAAAAAAASGPPAPASTAATAAASAPGTVSASPPSQLQHAPYQHPPPLHALHHALMPYAAVAAAAAAHMTMPSAALHHYAAAAAAAYAYSMQQNAAAAAAAAAAAVAASSSATSAASPSLASGGGGGGGNSNSGSLSLSSSAGSRPAAAAAAAAGGSGSLAGSGSETSTANPTPALTTPASTNPASNGSSSSSTSSSTSSIAPGKRVIDTLPASTALNVQAGSSKDAPPAVANPIPAAAAATTAPPAPARGRVRTTRRTSNAVAAATAAATAAAASPDDDDSSAQMGSAQSCTATSDGPARPCSGSHASHKLTLPPRCLSPAPSSPVLSPDQPTHSASSAPSSPVRPTSAATAASSSDAADSSLPLSMQKPRLSYAQLICRAIIDSTEQRRTLAHIYQWIQHNYPFFRTAETGWQNSIRHNLSTNKCFIKMPRPKDVEGKGCFWTVDPAYVDALLGADYKRQTKMSKRSSSSSSLLGACTTSAGVADDTVKLEPAPVSRPFKKTRYNSYPSTPSATDQHDYFASSAAISTSSTADAGSLADTPQEDAAAAADDANGSEAMIDVVSTDAGADMVALLDANYRELEAEDDAHGHPLASPFTRSQPKRKLVSQRTRSAAYLGYQAPVNSDAVAAADLSSSPPLTCTLSPVLTGHQNALSLSVSSTPSTAVSLLEPPYILLADHPAADTLQQQQQQQAAPAAHSGDGCCLHRSVSLCVSPPSPMSLSSAYELNLDSADATWNSPPVCTCHESPLYASSFGYSYGESTLPWLLSACYDHDDHAAVAESCQSPSHCNCADAQPLQTPPLESETAVNSQRPCSPQPSSQRDPVVDDEDTDDEEQPAAQASSALLSTEPRAAGLPLYLLPTPIPSSPPSPQLQPVSAIGVPRPRSPSLSDLSSSGDSVHGELGSPRKPDEASAATFSGHAAASLPSITMPSSPSLPTLSLPDKVCPLRPSSPFSSSSQSSTATMPFYGFGLEDICWGMNFSHVHPIPAPLLVQQHQQRQQLSTPVDVSTAAPAPQLQIEASTADAHTAIPSTPPTCDPPCPLLSQPGTPPPATLASPMRTRGKARVPARYQPYTVPMHPGRQQVPLQH